MKYVVAESNGVPPLRVITDQKTWRVLDKLKVGWVKLFEAETVAKAEALESLLPPAERVDKLTGVNK
jgi:hypothetical protein